MINRPKYLRQKDVMLINDVPVKKEIDLEEKFSSASNLNLLTTLRNGRINTFNQTPVKDFKGIISTEIYCTYLDYSYYGEPDLEGNFDFKTEFRRKVDLQEIRVRGEEENTEAPIYLVDKDVETLTAKSVCRHTFYKIDHQKDVYVSYRLKEQLDCLFNEIKEVQPKLIVITGKWGLFFLTGKVSLTQTMGNYKDKKPLGGLSTYRSSLMQLPEEYGLHDCIVIPMYHTITSMAMPDKIPMLELDVQKVGRMYHTILEKGIGYYKEEEKTLIAGEWKQEILDYLTLLLVELDKKPTLVSIDIETMFHSIIDCIGLTHSTKHGLCIPFAKVGNPNIWSLEDEVEIMTKLREVMLHKNCQHIGQNYNYDTSFYNKLWCMPIYAEWDTMILHHMLYNYLPKDLAFLASLYCEKYTYWKGELDATKETPEVRWEYNVKDVIYTLEVLQALQKILANQEPKLQELYRFQQNKLSPILDSMMWSGVRIDVAKKEELYKFFSNLLDEMLLAVNKAIGEDFNINSYLQKGKVFKDLLKMELVKTRKGGETCDASAMLVYLEEYPLYKPFLQLLLEHSSLKVFTNNFLGMELDEDNRARTQYKIAGTATGRLASTKNVWGRGGNLMNIPSKGKLDITQAVELADTESETFANVAVEGAIKLPNVKKIFLPDEGMEMCDGDYSGADIMVVAADSECKWLNDYFANPRGCGKVYAYIASEFLQREISPKDREYKTYKAVFHGCLTKEHEVLTPEGWVTIDRLTTSDSLMVWDKKDSSMFFEKPYKMNTYSIPEEESLVHIDNKFLQQVTTKTHKLPYKPNTRSKYRDCLAMDIAEGYNLPVTGLRVDGLPACPVFMKLIAAFQADGHILYTRKDGSICTRWRLTKQRKINRLQELLEDLDIYFKKTVVEEQDGQMVTSFFIYSGLKSYMKYFDKWLLNYNFEALSSLVEESLFWDGWVVKGSTQGGRYSTKIESNAKWLQTIAHLVGKSSTILKDSQGGFTVGICSRQNSRVKLGNIKTVLHKGTEVYCPTTSTGYFLVKAKGLISITGNSNYGMGVNRLAQMSGLSITLAKQLQDYYFQLNYEVKQWQDRVILEIQTKGYITNIFGRRGWYLNKNDPMLKNKALSFIPQSTIADLVNHAMAKIAKELPEVTISLQVHDSLVVQYPKEKAEHYRKEIVRCMELDIPYEPILKIPADIQVSARSYGDVRSL